MRVVDVAEGISHPGFCELGTQEKGLLKVLSETGCAEVSLCVCGGRGRDLISLVKTSGIIILSRESDKYSRAYWFTDSSRCFENLFLQ